MNIENSVTLSQVSDDTLEEHRLDLIERVRFLFPEIAKKIGLDPVAITENELPEITDNPFGIVPFGGVYAFESMDRSGSRQWSEVRFGQVALNGAEPESSTKPLQLAS